MEFGEYKSIDIRTIWEREDRNFTPWLKDNIQYLNECLNLKLNPQGIEKPAGSFSIDILANLNEETVIIENQFGKTDHTHLGQILTYLAYHNAKIAIWICEEIRSEHEKVINWLNENTDEDFYLIKLEVFKIDDSKPYPKFTKICGPSELAKTIRKQKEEMNEQQKLTMEFWDKFLEKLNLKFPEHSGGNTSKNPWIIRTAKKSGMVYSYNIFKENAAIVLTSDVKERSLNIKRIQMLKKKQEEIEEEFGDKLNWDINPTRKSQLIRYNLMEGGLENIENWDNIQNKMIDSMIKFISVIQKHVDELE
ncbi:MAG: DUF4268 domain-containing protein [Candidatus Lokiarchaeota archaeon]|nr:DUF4268 domain-containing protein [Candidatus Lokiarchaeota archaeon]